MFATFEVSPLFTPHIYSINDPARITSFLCVLQETAKAGKVFMINPASIILILLQILQNCLLPLPIFLLDDPIHKTENGFKKVVNPLHVLTVSDKS